MKVLIKKSGNGASVRIPASIVTAAALEIDQAVDSLAEGGRIILEPVRGSACDLDRLLDRM